MCARRLRLITSSRKSSIEVERARCISRFLQETRTAVSFSPPNIVPVHAVEERDKVLCFVMGYVDGETLTRRIQRAGPLPLGDVNRVISSLLSAQSELVQRDTRLETSPGEASRGTAGVGTAGEVRDESERAKALVTGGPGPATL